MTSAVPSNECGTGMFMDRICPNAWLRFDSTWTRDGKLRMLAYPGPSNWTLVAHSYGRQHSFLSSSLSCEASSCSPARLVSSRGHKRALKLALSAVKPESGMQPCQRAVIDIWTTTQHDQVPIETQGLLQEPVGLLSHPFADHSGLAQKMGFTTNAFHPALCLLLNRQCVHGSRFTVQTSVFASLVGMSRLGSVWKLLVCTPHSSHTGNCFVATATSIVGPKGTTDGRIFKLLLTDTFI